MKPLTAVALAAFVLVVLPGQAYQDHSSLPNFGFTGEDHHILLLAAGDSGKGRKLSPEERRKIESRRREYQQLPPDKRERIREARERYRQLSPEAREALRKRWENLSEEEKKRYRLESR